MFKKSMIMGLAVFCLPMLMWGKMDQPHSSSIVEVDEKIAELNRTLHKYYLQEMYEEVEGQGLMIADWEKYGQEVKRIRKKEEEIQLIQEEIHQLEQRKAQLLQEHSLTHD